MTVITPCLAVMMALKGIKTTIVQLSRIVCG